VVECKSEVEQKRSHECERGTQECVRHETECVRRSNFGIIHIPKH